VVTLGKSTSANKLILFYLAMLQLPPISRLVYLSSVTHNIANYK